MKPSVKRIVSTLIAVMALAASIVMFFNLITPLYEEIAVIRGEQVSRQSLLENQKRIIQQVKALQSSFQEEARLREIVSSALPITPSIAEALLQIHGIAQVNNLTVNAFVVQPTPPAPTLRNEVRKTALLKDVGSVTIRADVAGSYEDFKSFLKNLETNIRVFDVKTLTVQPIGKSSQNAYLYSVTALAHYQQQ